MTAGKPHGRDETMPTASFHLFPMLPTELRCRIWQLALSMPSVLQVTDRYPDDGEDDGDIWAFQYLARDPARNIGRVCTESRAVLHLPHSCVEQSPTMTDQPAPEVDPSRTVFHLGTARQAYNTLQAHPLPLHWEHVSHVSFVWTRLFDVTHVFRQISWSCAPRCAVYVLDSGPAETIRPPRHLGQPDIELLATMVEEKEGHHKAQRPVYIPAWLTSGEVVDEHNELAFYFSNCDSEAPTLTFLPMQ